ncbi:MAG: hypothetical protein EKK64_06495 [Neisseriaceae bacterium]|nr:MAG: hypothetical protein EKK64_06495 [Neisseriaceae bacterium]
MQISVTAKGFKIDGKQHFFGKLPTVLSGLSKGNARLLRKALWNAGHRNHAATKRTPSVQPMAKQEKLLQIA